jgi:hypothetical protein
VKSCAEPIHAKRPPNIQIANLLFTNRRIALDATTLLALKKAKGP